MTTSLITSTTGSPSVQQYISLLILYQNVVDNVFMVQALMSALKYRSLSTTSSFAIQ